MEIDISLLREIREQLIAASVQLQRQFEEQDKLETMCVANCLFNETVRPKRREENLRQARLCEILANKLNKLLSISAIDE